MKRREFVKKTAVLTAGAMLLPSCATRSTSTLLQQFSGPTIGHNSHQYRIDGEWGSRYASHRPVNDCHEMVVDSKQRIYLLTNETANNVLVYDRSGKLLNTWGTEYPGAHGLSIRDEGGEEFLFICDYVRHAVIKTTLDGRVVMTLPYPADSGKYQSANQYNPTETAVASNGDIYVADGYGEQHIIRYNHKGELLQVFGGRGDGEAYFDNAHGIAIDDRNPNNPTLLITARQRNQLKRFTLDGNHLSTIDLPGAFICRPVIDGSNVYLAVLDSRLPFGSESGFVLILDANDRIISAPGGSDPLYVDNEAVRMHQAIKVFKHPHDVCVDADKNIYVAQWNSGKVYPIRLERV